MALPSFLQPLVAIPSATSGAPTHAPITADAIPNPLPLSMQPQQQTEWCWAAAAASVSAFYRDSPPTSQCQLASQCLNMNCCVEPLPPPPPPIWPGNKMYTLNVALSVIGHLSGEPAGKPLDFATVVAEISAGRPVCCHISWESGPVGGHFNAIIGYDEVNEDVTIADPSGVFGGGTFPYKTFVTDYHGGKWDDSYLTQ